MQISIQGVNGEYSKDKKIVADSVEERSVEEGPTILSFPLNKGEVVLVPAICESHLSTLGARHLFSACR